MIKYLVFLKTLKRRGDLHTYVSARPAFEAVGVEFVDMENVNGTLDAEVVQLAGHFEE